MPDRMFWVFAFFCKKMQAGNTKKPDVTNDKQKDPASDVNRNRGFDRRISYIEYTEHAKCRMQCRNISQAEVEEIMKDGKINYNKSDVNAKPCPAYAVEGITKDDQRVRIVFGQCDFKTKVITCIDLEYRLGVRIAPAMMINIKTGINEDCCLSPLQWIYCIYAFIIFIAIMLVIFPFVIISKFFWKDQWR